MCGTFRSLVYVWQTLGAFGPPSIPNVGELRRVSTCCYYVKFFLQTRGKPLPSKIDYESGGRLLEKRTTDQAVRGTFFSGGET